MTSFQRMFMVEIRKMTDEESDPVVYTLGPYTERYARRMSFPLPPRHYSNIRPASQKEMSAKVDR